LPYHPSVGARAPVPHSQATPSILKDAGIYDKIAIPMKGGAYRHASLAKLLGEIAAPKVRSKSLNVVALEDLERRRLEAQAEAATSTLRDLTKRAQQKKLEADKSKAQGGAGAGGASKMLGASTLAVAGGSRLKSMRNLGRSSCRRQQASVEAAAAAAQQQQQQQQQQRGSDRTPSKAAGKRKRGAPSSSIDDQQYGMALNSRAAGAEERLRNMEEQLALLRAETPALRGLSTLAAVRSLKQDLRESLRRVEEREQELEDAAATCVVCFQAPRQIVLGPCGHEALCGRCADRVHDCPVCQRHVRDRLRVFHA